MSDTFASNPKTSGATREEILSALFAQMVIQQTNMAMMLMGKVPHPQSGETVQDLEGARMFIDQLEMLQAKTKGNLSPDEERLLKQSLLSAQMMFVDAVESAGSAGPSPTPTPSTSESKQSAPASESARPEASSSAGAAPAEAEAEGESKKKFSKKY
jgi:Domain of unknown function (DUF1844)